MDLDQPPHYECIDAVTSAETEDNSAEHRIWPLVGPRAYIGSFNLDNDETRSHIFMAPPGIDPSGTVTFHLWWDANQAGDVVWVFDHLAVADGEDWNGALTTVSLGTETSPGPGTTLMHTSQTATAASLGWVANDMLEIRLRRDADAGADTLAGDAYWLQLCVEIPVVR
jgi:hypothetical protein